MRRQLILLTALLLLVAIAGCKAVPKGAVPPENFALGEDIYIEGIDVSRLEIREAREAVQQRLNETIRAMQYDISLADGKEIRTQRLQAGELPIRTDLEDVLYEASYLPQHNGLRQQRRELDVTLKLDTDAAAAQIQRLCDAFYVQPVDATVTLDFSVDGMFTYTKESTGIQAHPDKLLGLLAQHITQQQGANISLPHEVLFPAYTMEQAQSEHQLISKFTTSFAKSPHNASGRVFNIKKAAELINGKRVEPGEEFNINAVLGPRNKERGWRTAAGIRDGRYQQEYGGGVCQVSTTLFNAIMMADLKITERHPHSWPSGYVDIGRDATISTGGPNFRFVNDSGYDIYVFAQTDSKKRITVSIYGKPLADGVSIKISSRQTGTLPSLGKDVLLDEGLPANTRLVFRQARKGKKSETYKEYYDANGELIRRETAYSDTYRSIRGTEYISADLYYGVSEDEEPAQVMEQ